MHVMNDVLAVTHELVSKTCMLWATTSQYHLNLLGSQNVRFWLAAEPELTFVGS